MPHFSTRTSFILGILIGVLLAFYYSQPKNTVIKNSYEKWIKQFQITRSKVSWDNLRYSNSTNRYLEANLLFNNIKILCLIIVKSLNNLEAIQNTWGSGCNNLRFIRLESRKKILPVKLELENSSWTLLCNFLHNISVNSFDWMVIVKDTSFVITENLRYYVAPLNFNEPHYLGYTVKFWNINYNNGDPGYVLSRGTVKKFQKNVRKNKCLEIGYRNKEDFYLGKHLMQLNINPINTMDERGFSIFYPYTLYQIFFLGKNFHKTNVFPFNCCSIKAIAFQANEASKMYTFNYLLYKLQIFSNGGHFGNIPYKNADPQDYVWKKFLKSRNMTTNNTIISSQEYYQIWENLINDPNSFATNLKKEQFNYNNN